MNWMISWLVSKVKAFVSYQKIDKRMCICTYLSKNLDVYLFFPQDCLLWLNFPINQTMALYYSAKMTRAKVSGLKAERRPLWFLPGRVFEGDLRVTQEHEKWKLEGAARTPWPRVLGSSGFWAGPCRACSAARSPVSISRWGADVGEVGACCAAWTLFWRPELLWKVCALSEGCSGRRKGSEGVGFGEMGEKQEVRRLAGKQIKWHIHETMEARSRIVAEAIQGIL